METLSDDRMWLIPELLDAVRAKTGANLDGETSIVSNVDLNGVIWAGLDYDFVVAISELRAEGSMDCAPCGQLAYSLHRVRLNMATWLCDDGVEIPAGGFGVPTWIPCRLWRKGAQIFRDLPMQA